MQHIYMMNFTLNELKVQVLIAHTCTVMHLISYTCAFTPTHLHPHTYTHTCTYMPTAALTHTSDLITPTLSHNDTHQYPLSWKYTHIRIQEEGGVLRILVWCASPNFLPPIARGSPTRNRGRKLGLARQIIRIYIVGHRRYKHPKQQRTMYRQRPYPHSITRSMYVCCRCVGSLIL